MTNKHKSSQSLPSNQVTCDQFSRYFQSDINQLKAAIPDAPHDISLLSSFCENKCYGHISSNIPLMTTTEVFTHYLHDPQSSSSLSNNLIATLLLDSKKNFSSLWLWRCVEKVPDQKNAEEKAR